MSAFGREQDERLWERLLAAQRAKTYRVMGRSGPIGRGLDLEGATKLARVSGCRIEEER